MNFLETIIKTGFKEVHNAYGQGTFDHLLNQINLDALNLRAY